MSTTTTTTTTITLDDALDAIEEYALDDRERAYSVRYGAGQEDRYLKGLSDGRIITADMLLQMVVRLRAGVR